MTADIIIPTYLDLVDLTSLLDEIASTTTGSPRVIPTCLKASAAINRNYGLDQATSDLVIMIDDDIFNLPDGWNQRLCQPLLDTPRVVMTSANLLRPNGEFGVMHCDPSPREGTGLLSVEKQGLPTACVAFRNDGLARFREDYIGSGYEDTDFSAQLRFLHPDGLWLVIRDLRVIHRNDQKAQAPNLAVNRKTYTELWGEPR